VGQSQGCEAGDQAILDGWSQSLKVGFPFDSHGGASASGASCTNNTMVISIYY